MTPSTTTRPVAAEVIFSVIERIDREAIRGWFLDAAGVLTFDELARNPNQAAGLTVLLLAREHGDERERAYRLAKSLTSQLDADRPCEILVPEVPWSGGESLDSLFEALPEALDTPGAKLAFLMDLPQVDRHRSNRNGHTYAGRNVTAPLSPPGDSPEEPWPELRLAALPEGSEFPLDVLPDAVAEFVAEVASSVGCTVDIPATQALASIGGLQGRSASLNLKPGYFASTSLYLAVVASVGEGKSPCLAAVRAPIDAIDLELNERYVLDLGTWAESAPTTGRGKGKPTSPPPKPQRIDVCDATFEKLLEVMADNPRGVIAEFDELSALLQGMNQYKRGEGNDRSHLLSSWSGSSIKVDRKVLGAAPLRVPHPCLTIIGGTQPSRLELFRPELGDGLIDRFLFAYPDPAPRPHWSERGVPEAMAARWAAVARNLWNRQQREKDGRRFPHTVHLTDAAKAGWIRSYNELVDETNAADFPSHLRGAWLKLGEYAGRFTLILALVREAASERFDPRTVPAADITDAGGAWRLVRYFQSHARRIHHHATQGGLDPDARAVVDWIRRHKPETFRAAQVAEHVRRFTGRGPALDGALDRLERLGAIRKLPPPADRGRGRPSHVYEIHPDLRTPS